MSRIRKPSKATVELGQAEARPSRIRREPPPQEKTASASKLQWAESGEREIWLAIAGIVAFALAINVIILAISAHWN